MRSAWPAKTVNCRSTTVNAVPSQSNFTDLGECRRSNSVIYAVGFANYIYDRSPDGRLGRNGATPVDTGHSAGISESSLGRPVPPRKIDRAQNAKILPDMQSSGVEIIESVEIARPAQQQPVLECPLQMAMRTFDRPVLVR